MPMQPAIAPTPRRIQRQGDLVTINGIRLTMPWVQFEAPPTGAVGPTGAAEASFGLSDVALRSLGGIELLDSANPQNQPIAWREGPLQQQAQRLELPAVLTVQRRYLELTPLQTQARWQVALQGESLTIQTRSSLAISSLLLGRVLGNAFSPHDIQWSPGIRWRQQYVRQGGAEFPVTQLFLSLGKHRPDGASLAPILLANDGGLVGIAPLGQTSVQAAAVINGGFFNRNNQTPLGAIRQNDRWISGPILNRGAIAWDDRGNIAMDRLQLQEELVVLPPDSQQASNSAAINPAQKPLPLIAFNSGYLKAGFSRYSQDWGRSYVPLTDNEVLLYVDQGRVVEQREAQKAGQGSFPLPQGDPGQTYLIVARSNRSGAAKLPVGTRLELRQQVFPQRLAAYPHSLGGGPLLLQEGKVVLDAGVEGFSKAFVDERAPRSAAVSFSNGSFALVTVHERLGGKGPSLTELALLLQSLGAKEAVNLDGGSSTQLFLGGRMINRDPRSAARVHNGLGVFQLTTPQPK
jgi:hypothetical protein